MNVAPNRIAAFLHDFTNVFQCGAPQKSVRANPERAVKERRALRAKPLEIGLCARDAFEQTWTVRDRAERGLDYGEACRRRLVHDMRELQGVVAEQHAVGVERDYVVDVAHMNLGVFIRTFFEMQRAVADNLAKVPPEQPHIAVQIHRLVGGVRQINVTLAFETREWHSEQGRKPPILAAETGFA